MRKRFLIAVAILFLFMSMSFVFAQTPTPTASPNSSPSPTPESPVKKETPKEVVVTKDGTEWFVTKDLLPVYTIPKLCPFMVGDELIFLSCEFPKLPVKPNPPVKVDPMSPGSPIPKPRIGMPGDGNSEQFRELRRQQLYDPLITMDDIKKSDAAKSTDVLTITNPSADEIKQQITPTPTPTPLAERVVEVINAWEKDDIVGKSPMPSKKQDKNWSAELTFETGVDSSYDGMDVGDVFHIGWVANQNINVEFSYKDKFYIGAYDWGQVPFTDLKAKTGWENDIGFYAGKKFSNGFGLEGGAAKFIVKGGSINDYSFTLSKDVPLQNGYSLGIGNETSFFTVSKGLDFRGGMVNKTSYNLSKELFNGGITPSITLAHSVDNNPFYDDKKLNVRGFITAEVKLAFSENYSWSFGGSYYFGIYRQTDRQNKGFFFIKITFGKKYEF